MTAPGTVTPLRSLLNCDTVALSVVTCRSGDNFCDTTHQIPRNCDSDPKEGETLIGFPGHLDKNSVNKRQLVDKVHIILVAGTI